MIRVTAIPLMVFGAPVAAQTLGLPPACIAFVTVQSADCTVTHYVTCSGDPAGQKYGVDIYSDGADSITVLDAEAQWLVSVDAYNQTVDTLVPDSPDPVMVSELLATGADSSDFSTVGRDGVTTRYIGKETLTGAQVTIDGVTLQVVQNETEALDDIGFQKWRAVGTQYVSADWQLFFGGPTDWTTPTESYPSNGSPVSFDFPGDPGFLSTVPVFGCTG